MKKILKDYLSFSKKERNGVLFLISLIALVFAFSGGINYWKDYKSNQFSQLDELIAELEDAKKQRELAVEKIALQREQMEEERAYAKRNYTDIFLEGVDSIIDTMETKKNPRNIKEAPRNNEKAAVKKTAKTVSTRLFAFDPNTVTKDQAITLGISPKVATTLINFRNKGGKFWKKEDLKKVYGLKEADYKRLEPYIQFPKKEKKKWNKPQESLSDFMSTIKPKSNTWKQFEKPVEEPPKAFPKEKEPLMEEDLATTTSTMPLVVKEQQREALSISPETSKLQISSSQTPLKEIEVRLPSSTTTEKIIAESGKAESGKQVPQIPSPKKETKQYGQTHVSAPKNPRVSAPSKTLINQPLFRFDPNKITHDQAIALGLSAKVATTLINFRNKGGKFWKKEDLKKVYGLKEQDFHRLESYIDIPSKYGQTAKKTKSYEQAHVSAPQFTQKNDTRIIDINQADTSDWKQLRGIGKVLSARIVKYRDFLGGFVRKEQIKEVYGLAPEVYDAIAPQLACKPAVSLKKVEVNKADFDALKSHPYIDYKLAKRWVKVRKKYGDFADAKALKQFEVLGEKELAKLLPYLRF